jgi:hypothetical protein
MTQANRGNALLGVGIVLAVAWCAVVAIAIPSDRGLRAFGWLFIGLGFALVVFARLASRNVQRAAGRFPRSWRVESFWESVGSDRLTLFHIIIGTILVATGGIVIFKCT